MLALLKTLEEPPICEREILRYAGCREANETVLSLMRTCLQEVRPLLSYMVVYRECSVTVSADVCAFESFSCRSSQLAANLSGCETALMFAATIGVGIDRLIAKYGHIAPSKAVMMQAIGTERVEALCDAFCLQAMQECKMSLRPRFSPGYGDLSLNVQRDIVRLLDTPKRIGVSLTDSCMLSPSKSVTAFAGVSREVPASRESKCRLCQKHDCAFRGVL